METVEEQTGRQGIGIDTLESLRAHLQWAIELELSTLPPYLCALYSLDPARNPAAAEVMTSVFVEEMLHTALAANLLNAVGGRPQFDTPRVLPPHPRYLPHSDRSFKLSLLPFSPEPGRSPTFPSTAAPGTSSRSTTSPALSSE